MRASTIYIITIIACIYWLSQNADRYKTRDQLYTDIAANVMAASFGGLVGTLATGDYAQGVRQLY